MSKCGKGCMPECEYFVTSGCVSPFNCPYKIEENYQNSAFTSGNSNFLNGIEKWFMQLVEEGKIPQTPMNYDMASYKAYVAHLETENAELIKKISQLEEQLKAISDRTACLPSLEQIKKRFLDWSIPFLKARITGCKEEWFGIEWIAKAIWEFIKESFETAIAVDETNAALRERLDKAVELPKPFIEQDGDGYYRVYSSGINIIRHAKQHGVYDTPEAAEARLRELQGGKE